MDQGEFTRAVERYQDAVYRVALHALGSPQDADDAVQEVFLRLYTARKPFEGEEHLRRWLLRVTVNWCRDMLRSPWRRRTAPLDRQLPAEPEFEAPEQEALYRAVLGLFYYEELTVKEIAGLLGLEVSAVTTRLSRARKKLKEILGEVWQDE